MGFHGYVGVQPRGLVALPADQQWFWANRWQEREREVDELVDAGLVTGHEDGQALLEHLEAMERLERS